MNPEKYPGRSDFFIEKSWIEFLDLVSKSDDLNYLGLLYPLSHRCLPCTIRYDVILKMETYEEDLRLIFEYKLKSNKLR